MLEERILGMMDRMVDSMTVFRGTETCTINAAIRVRTGQAPSSKAKQEFKDCEIFEEFLELLSMLRARKFDLPAVFVTSNKNDYGLAPEGHSGVASSLAPLSGQYAANLFLARNVIVPRPSEPPHGHQ